MWGDSESASKNTSDDSQNTKRTIFSFLISPLACDLVVVLVVLVLAELELREA